MNTYTSHLTGFVLFFILFSISSNAQQDVRSVNMAKLNELKKAGQLNGTEKYTNYQAQPQAARVLPPSSSQQSGLCNCWIDRDGSWQIGQFDYQGANGGPGTPPEYRNDDWSTDVITLPFNFCFYGQTVNSVYLNNNGNISIGSTYSTFTANPFPDPTFVMIAPFWADVDTRAAGSGLVYYKVTPTHAIFQWENVGYFNIYDDKLNTFQLIITDGNDTIIPPGDNVSFCYKDMQWTTGDASQGSGGFGGVPATVGINQGNGVDYIQVGLYDQPGSAWDGPYGNNDGIDALDNQSYFFNCCFSNSNIPPIIRSTAVCDTFHLCIGDTVVFDADYLSPEPAQVTTASVNTNGVSGITVLQQTTGNIAHIQVQIIADLSNVGYNTIYLIGTDNGVPSQTSSTPIVISVQPAPTAAATFTPASPITPGTTVTFTNTSTGLFSNWDFGDGTTSTTMNPSHTYNVAGMYYVTLVSMNPNGCTDTLIMQIEVVNCVTVNVVASASACEGDPVTFTYQGNASGAAIYNWNFGTGTVLSGSNAGPINVMWSTAGTYNVTLDVTDNGCTSNPVTVAVTVNPNPVASFTSAPSICAGDTTAVTFNGTAAAGAVYTWYFQNGSVVSGGAQGPVNVSFPSAGNDSIGLIVSQSGCADTSGNYILINPSPTSAFSVPASACEGSTLTVTYTGSAGGAATYAWNFGTGTVVSGSGQGPYAISWPAAGVTAVELTVTENGCTSPPTIVPVTINPFPVVSVTGNPTLCAGDQDTFTFNGMAGATASYTWSFGSATVVSGSGPGPYILSWPAAINDVITLIVDDNGCIDSTAFSVAVNPVPDAPFILPATVCAGNDVTITYSGTASAAASYNWNFGGGTIISGSGQGPYVINWNTPGNPQVTLSVTENGCTSPQVTNSISITPGPVASFTATPILCAGDQNTVSFTGSAAGTALWSWNFGSAAVVSGSGSGPYTLAYPDTGVYQIELIISDNGCSDTAGFTVQVNPVPNSPFALPPFVCEGVAVTIDYTGTASGAANYSWTFGGGTVVSGSGAGPYKVYWPSAGNMSVSLTVTENGCTSPVTTQVIVVNAQPTAAFTALQVLCSGESDTITFTGSASSSAIYTWSFGNATVISGSNEGPYILSWNNSGSQNLQLLVDDNGCVDTATVQVLINETPVAAFAMQPEACVGDAVAATFSGTATGNATYTWDFGSATVQSGTGQGPYSLLWNTPGNYDVSLVVTLNGCVSPLAVEPIVVAAYPAAIAGPDTVLCAGESVQIGFPPEAGVTYHWNPSAGLVDSSLSATTAAGVNNGVAPLTSTYVLTAVNATGCESTDAVAITVNPVPVVSFPSPAPQCFENHSFEFMAGGNMIPGAVYSWDFGTGAVPSTSNAQNQSAVTYTAPGAYPVVLNAAFANCPAVPYIDSAIVRISPVAAFTPLVVEGCEPLEVPLSNASTGDVNSYTWHFSDGSDATGENPVHLFGNAGTYSISVEAVTQYGCTDMLNLADVITVHPTPVAGFVPQPDVTTISEPLIHFNNFSELGDVYAWDFGDQAGSTVFSPYHMYADTGTYTIALLVTTTHGCFDTVSAKVRVEQGFTFYVPNAFTPDGNGANDYFKGYGTSIKQYEMRIFDRWGANIYTTEKYDEPWDGRMDGNPVQSDVYVYKIRLTDIFDVRHEYIGKVTLVR
jgi:gliding motility-associated-like protein